MKAVFVVSTPLRDPRAFAVLARQAAVLRPFGRVEVNIASLAAKARHELPPDGSPWHEYASYSPSLHKFFPPRELAHRVPHLGTFCFKTNIDLHGTRRTPTGGQPGPREPLRIPAGERFLTRAAALAAEFEALPAAGRHARFFRRMAAGVCAWASVVRSRLNFHAAQIIRDRHAAELAGPPRRPARTASWSGNRDLLRFNEIQRDELDNAAELYALVRADPDLLARAARAADEDTFLLGPDLARHLLLKQRIMRRHWRDLEDYLDTPNR
jgi:hypothetical protein